VVLASVAGTCWNPAISGVQMASRAMEKNGRRMLRTSDPILDMVLPIPDCMNVRVMPEHGSLVAEDSRVAVTDVA